MSETKTTSANSVQVCQNCQQKFTIEPDDFAFYEKITKERFIGGIAIFAENLLSLFIHPINHIKFIVMIAGGETDGILLLTE